MYIGSLLSPILRAHRVHTLFDATMLRKLSLYMTIISHQKYISLIKQYYHHICYYFTISTLREL